MSLLVVGIIVSVPGVAVWLGFEVMQPEHWLPPVACAGLFLGSCEFAKLLTPQTRRKVL